MKLYLLLVLGLIFILITSCKSSKETAPPPADNIIATFADERISIEELKRNFYRNRESKNIDSSEFLEFYASYVNYRIKLYEGYQKGYHKDSTILAEFNQYATEIARRFWIENKLKRERIETFKERFDIELKAFHLLVQTPENALPGDTTEVYNMLSAVRDSLLKGASPEKMNELYSSKHEGQPVGGQLSWITAGTTIESFEDAVYSLTPGEISMPIRSQFGYHLIILQEIRIRTPHRLIKHIFVRKNEQGSDEEKITKAYEALKADSSWGEVLQKYTEDPTTRNRDGSLGWIGYGGRFPTELIDLAVQVDPTIPYSKPLEVSYGYHILKVDSVRTFTDEVQKENFIVNRLEELDRLNPDTEDLYDRIGKESDLMISHENFTKLRQSENQITDIKKKQNDLFLIQFNGNQYTTSDFRYWLNNIDSENEILQSGDLSKSYRDYIIQENLVDFTRNRFPEFANQVDHFLDGLIVFKLNEDQIWNINAIEKNRLRSYYQKNVNKYKRAKLLIYTNVTTETDSLMTEVYRNLLQGKSIEKIADQYSDLLITKDSTFNTRAPLYLKLEKLKAGEFTKPITVNGTTNLYILNDIKKERTLSFEEAMDQVYSDYQPLWEEEYLNKLKEIYNLKLYPENLQL